ncbi:YidC/Oxa1 family membrane protein insertase [Actinomadura parmotrematis]|uniref:Membrane protein insertase YidC n=1 Tax=Actinomadura parmotrematis TaxID=2864039 RepID=A0ABS7FP86_9ACTN|nr:membrane protein insertase YidC [Actinomadura parmotrematis]MBW8482176.1 YidC/Oxa1 family membrane protein insertase [Actinomadura parmotrematis]
MFDLPVSLAYRAVSGLAGLLAPLAGGLATAAAILVFTLAVRLALAPLAVAQARGRRSQARLLPQMKELRDRHAGDPARLRRETAALYSAEGASPLAGCLPALLQWPFFLVMYRLFTRSVIAGHQNLLLAHTLLAAPLGQNWIGLVGGGAGLLAPASLVFLGLFALLAAVAWWSARQMPAGPLRLVPFATVAAAAVVPLAAGLYLLAGSAWTAGERAVLRRRFPAAA